ncbi:hypothetical protein [Nostoc sp. NMS8]|uniref:hypothetical protein n=1 Tax=Nostoc sp. NMS8 TaxID=2815392 RepID=UPI0025E8779C|nr:hypothetical protein [Nostoc sp. NMS8]MBN3962835.1 hypothetical protein [Nostoc sp. NMS8]
MSLLLGYGVHTSREILPDTWFRPLALGCAIALKACHCEEERRSNRKNLRDYVITSLRYHCARNDNLRGL